MSMRSPIPKAIREQLAEDPFMKVCIVNKDCEGRVEFDHAFKYAGKRVNEIWAILPVCTKHNHAVTKEVQFWRNINLKNRIAHFDAEEQFLKDYPKSDLFKV